MPFKSPFSLRNRLIFANAISNAVGVCVVMMLLHQFNISIPPRVMELRVWIDPVFLILAFLYPVLAAVRYERPIRRYLDAKNEGLETPPEMVETARRRILNEPFVLIGLGLSVWITAAVLYTVIFWACGASRDITTYPLTISLYTGLITTTVAFFVIEHVLQRRVVPHIFPDGGLSRTPGTFRIRIRTRLIALLFACNFVPFIVILSITHSTPSPFADPRQVLQDIQSAITVNAVLFLVLGLWVTLIVSGNLRRPLEEIIRVLQGVRRGKFDRSVRVTSNDEIGYTGDVINEMTRGLRERDFIKEVFGRYVSSEIRDEILAGRIPLDGEVKEATVLFADLQDFTPMVESTPPKDVVRIINSYFREMNEAIKAHRGLVIQFIGDEIEAVFGAPVYHQDHADAALRAARDMCGRLEVLNRELTRQGFRPLAHRIGIHTGSVVAANIGSPDRLAYSLVGDTVNVAARLQGLNREFGTQVLLSEATRHRLGDSASLKALPRTRVKGRQEPVDLYTPA